MPSVGEAVARLMTHRDVTASVAVEPIAGSAALVERNAKDNGLNITVVVVVVVVAAAAGARTGKGRFAPSSRSNAGLLSSAGEVEVDVIDITELVALRDFTGALSKMDIEGGEEELLLGHAEPRWASRFDCVIAEFHRLGGDHQRFIDALCRVGFRHDGPCPGQGHVFTRL